MMMAMFWDLRGSSMQVWGGMLGEVAGDAKGFEDFLFGLGLLWLVAPYPKRVSMSSSSILQQKEQT